MNRTQQSIFYFGIYLIASGCGLLFFAEPLLTLYGMNAPQDGWVYFGGAMGIWLGAYYIVAARTNLVPFFRATVVLRGTVLITFITFVFFDLFAPGILLVGTVDTLGAVWTAWALRADANNDRLMTA
jgi:hypothetical protein